MSSKAQRFRKTELDRICAAVKRHGVAANINPSTGCVEVRPLSPIETPGTLTDADRLSEGARQIREAFGE